MGIRFADAVDFFHLARGQFLVGVKAPTPFEQSLTSQDFVDSRNAAVKLMRGIEDGGIRVGDMRGE